MRDALLSMYEQNEQYHTAKETMFWLSSTLYLGFSAYVVNWILTVHLENYSFLYVVGVALALVLIFAAKFSKRQNWLKCLSVVKSEWYAKLLLEALDDDSIRKGLRELDAEVNRMMKKPFEDRKVWRKENRKIWLEKGKPGAWIMPLLWLFFLAQLMAIVFRASSF